MTVDPNYLNRSLPDFWTMVQDDDGAAASYHLNMWERQITLLTDQRKRLVDLQAMLNHAWPTETSEAAKAFDDRITAMIDAMDFTVRSSSSVYSGLAQTSAALENARTEIALLCDQYIGQQSKLESIANQRRHNPVGAKGMPPNPALVALATAQQELNERAREIMRSADRAVVEANGATDTPLPHYERIGGKLPLADDGIDPASSGSSARSGRPGFSTFVPAAQANELPVGPVLAGQTPLPVDRFHGLGNEQVPPGNGNAGSSPGRVIGAIPSVGIGRRSGTPGEPARASGGRQSASEPGELGRRPGSRLGRESGQSLGQEFGAPGVIGGRPGTAPEGRLREGRGSSNRAHGQSGGGRIIGGPGTAPTDSATVHPTPTGRIVEGGRTSAPADTGGWRDRQFEQYAKRRRDRGQSDPDDPWAVREGVTPVLEPSPERPHTVGPGVIGLDR
jgi:hypothetical protein